MWFVEVFPNKLLDKLKTCGDIHDGIIIGKIFNPDKKDVEFLPLLTKRDQDGNIIETYQVYTHLGTCVGLGEFVLDWFSKDAKEVVGVSREMYEIETELFEMLRNDLHNFAALKKSLSIMQEVLRVIPYRESSSDSESTGIARRRITRYDLLEGAKYMHMLKVIKGELANYLTNPHDKRKLQECFYDDCFEKIELHHLDEKGRELAFERSKLLFSQEKPSSYEEVLKKLNAIKTWATPKAREERAAKRGREEGKAEGREEGTIKAAVDILEDSIKGKIFPINKAKIFADKKLAEVGFVKDDRDQIIDEICVDLSRSSKTNEDIISLIVKKMQDLDEPKRKKYKKEIRETSITTYRVIPAM